MRRSALSTLLVLLVGCAGPGPLDDGSSDEPTGLPPSLTVPGCGSSGGAEPDGSSEHRSDSSTALPGVTVNATHAVEGRLHAVAMAACNAGPHTYYVYTSQSGAWTDSMRGPDGEVATRNELYTQECGWTAFRPGEVLRGHFTWDETLYQGQDNDGQERPAKPAPSGDYLWTVTFTAWNEDTCPYQDDWRHVEVAFELTV